MKDKEKSNSPPDGKTLNRTLSFEDHELKNDIEEFAKEDSRSMNGQINWILKLYARRRKAKRAKKENPV